MHTMSLFHALFIWHKEKSELVSEASTLGFPVGERPGRIEVLGRTGKKVTFWNPTEVIKDNEVVAWRYFPMPECLKIAPEADKVTLLIFND